MLGHCGDQRHTGLMLGRSMVVIENRCQGIVKIRGMQG